MGRLLTFRIREDIGRRIIQYLEGDIKQINFENGELVIRHSGRLLLDVGKLGDEELKNYFKSHYPAEDEKVVLSEPMVTVFVRLPKQVVERLDEIAAVEKVSRSEVIRRILSEGV